MVDGVAKARRGRSVSGRRLGVMAAALTAIASHGALAQGASTSAWDKLVAAAETEGEVALAANPNPQARSYLLAEWAKDFPKIELKFTGVPNSGWFSRVAAERQAGKYLWDVFTSGQNDGYQLVAAKYVVPLDGLLVRPDVADDAVWRGGIAGLFEDPEKRVIAPFSFPQSMWYDAERVSPEKVKKEGLHVLLDPAYQGQMVFQDPRIGGTGIYFGVLIHDVLGTETLKRIMVDQRAVLIRNAGNTTERIIRKQAIFMLGGRLSEFGHYAEEGLKFDIRPGGSDPENAWLSTGGVTLSVFDKAPHPNAARVFANWILTQKVQDAEGRIRTYNSKRRDVAPHADGGLVALPDKKYIEPQKYSAIDHVRQVSDLIRQLRPD
jgi:iron(III) transport system substrate-binding protein